MNEDILDNPVFDTRVRIAMLYKAVIGSRALVIQAIFKRYTLKIFQSCCFNYEVT